MIWTNKLWNQLLKTEMRSAWTQIAKQNENTHPALKI
jgi:hypothetical protein